MNHRRRAALIMMAISLSGCQERDANRTLEESVRILQAAETSSELDTAAGDLGIVLRFPDGAWMAIRYLDRHEPIEAVFSLAVARDSEDGWFCSDEHFCGDLAAYRHTVMGKEGIAEDELDSNYRGIHAVATSADLSSARRNLKALKFRRLEP